MITGFVGLPLPREVADVLEKAQGGLHAGEPVPRECFFVSVVALGELSEEMLGTVRRALAEVRAGPFYLSIDGVDTQGGKAPRVVHAGTDTPRGLRDLHTEVCRTVRKAGLPLEPQQPAPSVAIAEFDELGPNDLREIMSFLSRREALHAGPFAVTDFDLIVMRETGEGLVQEAVESYPLSL